LYQTDAEKVKQNRANFNLRSKPMEGGDETLKLGLKERRIII